MTGIDWTILCAYIILIVGMSWIVSHRQHSQIDYYPGHRNMPSGQVAMSVLATQASSISLIGAIAIVYTTQAGYDSVPSPISRFGCSNQASPGCGGTCSDSPAVLILVVAFFMVLVVLFGLQILLTG